VPDIDPHFGPRLRSLREARRLTVQDLAEAAGVSRPTVYDLEAGTRTPTWPTVLALADALDVTPDHFLPPA
jgi:transcriptional regulator with XRE-family HTH domain